MDYVGKASARPNRERMSDLRPDRPAVTHDPMKLADELEAAIEGVLEKRGLMLIRSGFGWDRYDYFRFTLQLARVSDYEKAKARIAAGDTAWRERRDGHGDACERCEAAPHEGHVDKSYSAVSGWLCAECCAVAFMARTVAWPNIKEPFL
jgi:hypothetical protein